MPDYTPKTFASGDILTADNMNNVDLGINQALALGRNALTASSGVSVTQTQTLTDGQRQQARSNIGAAHIVVNGTTLEIS